MVSLLRQGPQAAKLRISVDGRVRMEELVCDGALLCTPAGSTAYNYSAHGPILPIGSEVLALTAVAAFRPRRLARGDPSEIRPVCGSRSCSRRSGPSWRMRTDASVRDVAVVDIRSEPNVRHRILFDPGHGLEERLIREQFV